LLLPTIAAAGFFYSPQLLPDAVSSQNLHPLGLLADLLNMREECP